MNHDNAEREVIVVRVKIIKVNITDDEAVN